MAPARALVLVVALLSLSCGESDHSGGTGNDMCPDTLQHPALAACASSSLTQNSTPEGQGLPRWSLSFTGKVVEQGSSEPPNDCLRTRESAIGAWSSVTEYPRAPSGWLRLKNDQGQEAVVGVSSDGFAFRDTKLGDVVSVDFHTEAIGFAPVPQHLVVRSASGALLAFAAFGGDTQDLVTPPELSVTTGAVECMFGPGDCISSATANALDVRAGNARRSLHYGELATLGTLDVLHGGLDIQTGDSTCPDAYVAWAAIAAWPHK